MSNWNWIITFVLIVFSLTISAQRTNTSDDKFELSPAVKIGYSILNTENFKSFSGNINVAELLIGYKIKDKVKISSGLALVRFNSNYFEENQQFGFESSFLQIPLKANFGYGLLDRETSKNINLILGVGILGSFHIKEKLENYDVTFNNNFQGWHFGMMTELGLEFKLSHEINIGLLFESNFANKSFAENEDIRLENNLVKLVFNYIL